MADAQQDPGSGDPPEPTPHPVSAVTDPAGDADPGPNSAHEPPDGADTAPDEPDDRHVLPDEVEYAGGGSALPPAVERWRRRSATGAMLTGFAMGLRDVIEPEHRQPAIVLETSGTPPRDLAVEADLDHLPPRQSVVKVRRWLLHDPDAPGPDAATGPDTATGRDSAEDTAAGEVGSEGAEAAAGNEQQESGAAPTRPTEIRARQRRPRRSRIFGGKRS